MGENVCWHVEVRRYDRAMAGYEPVTIEAVCNAGVDVLEDAAGELPLGRVELRGLPSWSAPTLRRRSGASSCRQHRSRSRSAGRRGG
jgi:hypothetical protein